MNRDEIKAYIEALSDIVCPDVAQIFNTAIEIDSYLMDTDGWRYLLAMINATNEQKAEALTRAKVIG